MNHESGPIDPSMYIGRLSNDDAFYREAAAWSLGEMGSPKAGRPLAGLLLREIKSVERSGAIEHPGVVHAGVEAIRKLGATDALYALVRSLCTLVRSRDVDRDTVERIVDTLAEVGGPNAVREAADRVVQCVRACHPQCPGMHAVSNVLLERLCLCGDAAVRTLRRLANNGPHPLRPIARRTLEIAVG